MSSPEISPASPPKIAEKKGKERFATTETHLPGVSLRTEPGFDVDILRSTIEKFYALAKDYARRKFQIDKLTAAQKAPDSEIKGLAVSHEGLRGIKSESDKFVLSVLPRDSLTWDHKLLRESLGIAYTSVVHEDLVIAISVPAGFPTERGPIQEELLHQVLTQSLLDIGLPKDGLDKIMSTKVEQRIDEKTLEQMIQSGKVSLLEGTKQTSRTWAIRVDSL